LVAVSGAYGANGTEYRTEIESFTRIISYGTTGNGPNWFEARTKSGQIVEYGNTINSKIEAKGLTMVRAWAVNRIKDTKNNYLDVTYEEDTVNGDYRPLNIAYTGNAGQGVSNIVSFEYEDRPDAPPHYLAGSLIRTAKRLTKIVSYGGGLPVQRYQLAYGLSPANQRSRLESITQCELKTNTCLAPTILAWQGESNFSFSLVSNRITSGDIDNGTGLTLGDWNADGISDARWYRTSDGDNRWYLNDGQINFSGVMNPIENGTIDDGVIKHGDFNGDGIIDLVWYRWEDGNQRWCLNNGQLGFNCAVNPITPSELQLFIPLLDGSSIPVESKIYLGDWNGDGITDAMWYFKDTGKQIWAINNGAPGFTLIRDLIPPTDIDGGTSLNFGDWNGDGITDLMWWNKSSGNNRWYVLSYSNGLLGFTNYTNPIVSSDVDNGTTLDFGDWNGDGNTDALWFSSGTGTQRWFTNNGKLGFTTVTSPIDPTVIDGDYDLYLGDWNQDGHTDVVWHNKLNGRQRWYMNDGWSQFTSAIYPILPDDIDGGTGLYFGDFNGDGLTEPVWYSLGSGNQTWFTRNEPFPDLLVSITNGLGATTQVGYQPLTNPLVHQRCVGGVSPVRCLSAPLYVVDMVTGDNGVGGQSTTRYTYAEARVHAQGRGFLGFASRTATDEQTHISTRTDYRQDYPFTGLAIRSEKRHNGTLLNLATTDYGDQTLGSGSSLRHFPHAQHSVEERHELDGSLITRTTTDQTYDAYGNPTQIVVTSNDGHSKTTVNTYDNDTTNWILGRLRRATVTSTAP
jgi:hypothetical protein